MITTGSQNETNQTSKYIPLRCCNEGEPPRRKCVDIVDHCPSERESQQWYSGDPGYKGHEAQNQNGKHKTKVRVNRIEQKGHVSDRC